MTPSRFHAPSMGTLALLALASPALLGACGQRQEAGAEKLPSEGPEAQQARLGPTDGRDLPPTEIDRVAVGTISPDFTLRSLRDSLFTLSDFRGAKDVILVFYRGHW